MIYVVVACHFKSRTELCSTTIARLRVARNLAKSTDLFLVTGDVPYSPGGPTLGELMKDWLEVNDVWSKSIMVVRGGVGTFSEARIVCELLKNEKKEKIFVVSSSWYFLQGRSIWYQRGQENHLDLQCLPVFGTGGYSTRLTYAFLGIFFRVASILGLEKTLEKFITSSQEKRRAGFTFNGCK